MSHLCKIGSHLPGVLSARLQDSQKWEGDAVNESWQVQVEGEVCPACKRWQPWSVACWHWSILLSISKLKCHQGIDMKLFLRVYQTREREVSFA